MAKTILVVLSGASRIEMVTAYLEEVARAGMKVVFLFPFPVESWPYWRDHWIEADTPTQALSKAGELAARYSWASQRALVEQKISTAREVLRKKHVEVEADLYTGSWRKFIQNYKPRSEIHWIVMAVGLRDWIDHLISTTLSLLGLRRKARPISIPILHQMV